MPIHILSLRRHEILNWTQSNSDCPRHPAQNPLLSEGDFKLQLGLIQPTKVIESNLTILLRTRIVFCVFFCIRRRQRGCGDSIYTSQEPFAYLHQKRFSSKLSCSFQNTGG